MHVTANAARLRVLRQGPTTVLYPITDKAPTIKHARPADDDKVLIDALGDQA
jgi:hypothetical protein